MKKEEALELAILLHKTLCHSNHMDMCSWEYEIHNGNHDWNGWTHKMYLKKALKMYADGITVDEFKKIAPYVRSPF